MWMPSSAQTGAAPARLFAFFREIVDRLHGEEITRLRQKQAEYLALQNQISPHFLYNALEAIRSDALLADCADIAETTEALATFFAIPYQMYRNMSHFRMNWTMRKTISPSSAAASATNSKWSLKWKMKICLRRECRLSILQPLVENAVVHGLEGKIGHGIVYISIENSANTLFLRVKDNGVGMPEGAGHVAQRGICPCGGESTGFRRDLMQLIRRHAWRPQVERLGLVDESKT